MSLEDLMNVEVTSVSKQKQRVGDAPAAIHVITSEDIRRSGMSSIPELLRLAPGVHVAQFNANQWGIGVRGFTNIYSEKLLVLQDGRTLYSPVFSGTYWDVQDYVLPDIDRIEVIRGPGATVWGANAVNGVINIISKEARDTQGGLVLGRIGTEDQVGSVRYGGKIDDKTYYRIYGKYRNIDDLVFASGDEAFDGSESERAGFRIDRYATADDTLTLQGDIFNASSGQTLGVLTATPPFFAPTPDEIRAAGGNLLGRWTHILGDRSDLSVQIYYDRTERDDGRFSYDSDTIDIDAQHRFPIGQRQELIWGLGYRFVSDEADPTFQVSFDPESREFHTASAFVQDDITLVPDRLHLVVGSKFEVNSFSGFEVQPSARMIWTPDEKQSIWGAVSRAVRTPARLDEDIRAIYVRTPSPLGPPVDARVVGRNGFKSEELLAFEFGHRISPIPAMNIDTTAFYNDYNRLRSLRLGPPRTDFGGTPPRIIQALPLHNDGEGESWGFELATTAQINADWRVTASYTYFNAHMQEPGPPPDSSDSIEEQSPANQFQLRTSYQLTREIQLNGALFYVDTVRGFGIPSHFRTDLSLQWTIRKDLELTIGVQNAFDDRHPEFGTSFQDAGSEVERAAYFQFAWKF